MKTHRPNRETGFATLVAIVFSIALAVATLDTTPAATDQPPLRDVKTLISIA